jgi:mannose-1-phosphate guanylyltransferase
MKALLLAAGYGSRLGKVTALTPKPMVKVGERPIISFCLDQLIQAGVSEVVVNTHYLANLIDDFLKSYESPLNIHVSHEEKLLGTAGTTKKHFDYLATDDFIVMHADNYFVSPLRDFVSAHKLRNVGKYGTLGTFHTEDPKNCGVLVLNTDKTILEFHEKVDNPPSRIANAAIYLFTPAIREVLFHLNLETPDLSRHLIPLIKDNLYTHHFDGLFVDIGTPKGLAIANNHIEDFNRSRTD